jgi:hypothetical protein
MVQTIRHEEVDLGLVGPDHPLSIVHGPILVGEGPLESGCPMACQEAGLIHFASKYRQDDIYSRHKRSFKFEGLQL